MTRVQRLVAGGSVALALAGGGVIGHNPDVRPATVIAGVVLVVSAFVGGIPPAIASFVGMFVGAVTR